MMASLSDGLLVVKTEISLTMGKIKILNDADGDYGYPVGTILPIDKLFKDFQESNDCNDSLYSYLCGIPIPHAVDAIAEKWGLDYEFV